MAIKPQSPAEVRADCVAWVALTTGVSAEIAEKIVEHCFAISLDLLDRTNRLRALAPKERGIL